MTVLVLCKGGGTHVLILWLLVFLSSSCFAAGLQNNRNSRRKGVSRNGSCRD